METPPAPPVPRHHPRARGSTGSTTTRRETTRGSWSARALAAGAPHRPRRHRSRRRMPHPSWCSNSLSHPRTGLVTVDAPDAVTAPVALGALAAPVQRGRRRPGHVRGHGAPVRLLLYDLVAAGPRPTARRCGPGSLGNERSSGSSSTTGPAHVGRRRAGQTAGPRPGGERQPFPAAPRLSQLLRRLGRRPLFRRPGRRPRRGRLDRGRRSGPVRAAIRVRRSFGASRSPSTSGSTQVCGNSTPRCTGTSPTGC